MTGCNGLQREDEGRGETGGAWNTQRDPDDKGADQLFSG